jgi:uncharacterized membrane protein YfcA
MREDGIHPKVTFATLGSGVGLGFGSVLTRALVAMGWLDQHQADGVAPVIDWISTMGFTFLGGYLKS